MRTQNRQVVYYMIIYQCQNVIINSIPKLKARIYHIFPVTLSILSCLLFFLLLDYRRFYPIVASSLYYSVSTQLISPSIIICYISYFFSLKKFSKGISSKKKESQSTGLHHLVVSFLLNNIYTSEFR
ncbi:hypothetical protein BVRB_1g016030 [Beta vulgaris subsp. vulgaris]|nr:hypothetical protein BVRB_1g016030 [Beta vulgaris subsp. vulgaris]